MVRRVTYRTVTAVVSQPVFPLAAEEYARQARRIRAQFASKPGERAAKLRELGGNTGRSYESQPGRAGRTAAKGVESTPRESARMRAAAGRDAAIARTQTTRTRAATNGKTAAHDSKVSGAVSPMSTKAARCVLTEKVAASAAPLLSIPTDIASAFTAEVKTNITGGILRFTSRRRLVARASRMRIPAFEANLLIASVLHATRPEVIAGNTATAGDVSAGKIIAIATGLASMLAVYFMM